MPPPLLFLRLAVQHLRRRPVRTALLALAVAVGGATLFCSTLLSRAVRDSMGVSLDRLGADLMVVPRKTTVNLSAALLTVEPTGETFDLETAERLARLPGVLSAAPQRHFTLPGAGGHGDEDLIAFDPSRDFTVLPWLAEKLDRQIRRGDVIVGGRRAEDVGTELRLFGRVFTVYGKLSLTGVGPFERAMFVSFDTAADVATAARETTGRDLLDVDNIRYSALLVRLRVGATPAQYRFVAAQTPAVQVVTGNGLTTSVRQGLEVVLGAAVVFAVLALAGSTLMLAAMYSGMLGERQRELGLLLAVGMRPGQLVRLVVAEAVLTTGLGGVCGVLLGAAGFALFRRSLGHSIESAEVPLALPVGVDLLTTVLLSVLACCAVGLVGAAIPAWRAGRREPYELMR